MRGAGWRTLAALAAITASAGLLAAGPQASASATGQVAAAPPGTSIRLGGLAGTPAANPRTDTVYVPVQSRNALAVINAATCNRRISSGCRVVARARAGSAPIAAVIDQRTDTVYVLDHTGMVSVLNGARCNAMVHSGCGLRPLAKIGVGKLPLAAAINPATRTIYVANLNSGTISVINAAACNAHTTRGCGQPPRTIVDRAGPAGVDVDVATDTVYVANGGVSGNGNTVSVINGATCNGHTGVGCGSAPHTVRVGSGAFWVAVNQARNAVYVPDANDGTVSVINGAQCNAKVTAGCGRKPPAVTTGASPQFVALDSRLHTLFAINQGDETLSAIDMRTCNGTVTSGCRKVPPSLTATFSPAAGFNANSFALIPRLGTAYLANSGGANIVSVVSVRGCNAIRTARCRRLAPSVPNQDFLLSADPATGTIYAGSLSRSRIDVLNEATCRAGHLAGCAPVAEIPMAHPEANVGSVDDATHTLYASDPFSNTVSVINTASCNARNTAGCAKRPREFTVGAGPGPPVLNPATHTVYVPFGAASDKVAVLNAATCNASLLTGCRHKPVASVGNGTFTLAVSVATDTIYGANTGLRDNGSTLSVLNGATCDATDRSGCGHRAATAKVGFAPFGVAVDDHTHTLYVANSAGGELPGTVSVVNIATCNGTRTSGCRRHFRTMATGRAPLVVAVDVRTGLLYVTNFNSASVSILNGARCNASVTAGCRAPGRERAVGSSPQGMLISGTGTIYVVQAFQSGALSVFRAARRR